MPLVEQIQVDTDDEEYDSFRPDREDLQKDDIQKRLKEIEIARKAAIQKKRSRSAKPPGPAPKPETGFKHPVFDQDHYCWKSQSKTDPKQVKVWDEEKSVWRSRESNRESNMSGNALLGAGLRKESWFQNIRRRTSVWFFGS